MQDTQYEVEEEQTEQQPQTGDIERISTAPTFINSEFYRLKLKTDSTLKKIYEQWLRVAWVDDESRKEGGYLIQLPNQEPLMNEQGCQDVLTVLWDVINKENIQGNVDDDFIRLSTIEHVHNISNLLFVNHREYAIKNPVNCDIVVDDCGTIIFNTLSRALNAGERNSLKVGSEVKETITNVSNEPKKKGLFRVFGND
jgi:hypothetical protein